MIIPILAQLAVAAIAYFVPVALPYKAGVLFVASAYIWYTRLEWIERALNTSA